MCESQQAMPGNYATAAQCAEDVATEHPNANGATYKASSEAENCYANFATTHIDTSRTVWQACLYAGAYTGRKGQLKDDDGDHAGTSWLILCPPPPEAPSKRELFEATKLPYTPANGTEACAAYASECAAVAARSTYWSNPLSWAWQNRTFSTAVLKEGYPHAQERFGAAAGAGQEATARGKSKAGRREPRRVAPLAGGESPRRPR